MHFLVIARDFTDPEALNRRMAARTGHLQLGDEMIKQGKFLYGVAILDDTGKMVGSTLVCNFDSRADVDDWLKVEPYVTGRVWENIEVTQCRIGPSFHK